MWPLKIPQISELILSTMVSQASPVRPANSSDGKRPIRLLDPTTTYNLWSEVYDTDGNFLQALDTIEMRNLLPKMLSQISCPPPWKIVDLGCGTGRNTTRLLDLPSTMVIGLDASPKMLEVARSKIDTHTAQISRAPDAAQGAQLVLYNMLGSDRMPSCALNADALSELSFPSIYLLP